MTRPTSRTIYNPTGLARFLVVAHFLVGLVTAPVLAEEHGSGKSENVTSANAQPLDLSEFQDPPSPSFERFFGYFTGWQVVDNVPLNIYGRVTLFGKTTASRGHENREIIQSIKVGRKFDNLHLVHHTFWPDVEGEAVAHVWLNYADGTKYIIPIRYGYQVRDWFNLPSYEHEQLADPHTSICWRRAPVQFNAPVRLFKSRLANPIGDKVVESIDISSAQNLASYALIAATVSDTADVSDENEIVTDRNFDGKISLSVVDDTTGKPIEKALVQISILVEGHYLGGTPIYTSVDGTGAITYPTNRTARITARITKDGYRGEAQTWRTVMPAKAEFRLKPATN